MSEQKNRTITDLICRQDAIDALSRGACGNVCRKAIERIPSVPGYAAKMNLNDKVKVKLTAFGIKIYIDYMNGPNEGREHNPVIKPKDCVPYFDKDGYTHFQLWELFNIYGEHMTMAAKPMFFPMEIVKAE